MRFLFLLFVPLLVFSTAQAASVVTSFSILSDWVRQIAPASIQIKTLAGVGEDPHGFQPRPSDLRALKSSDLIFQVGEGFEPWLDRAVTASKSKAGIIKVSKTVKLRNALGLAGEHDHHHHGHHDPHFWHDPQRVIEATEAIRVALRAQYPVHRAEIDSKATAFTERLRLLDAEIKKIFAAIPKEKKNIITAHGAFGYFAAAYDLQISSPQGWSTEIEPTAKTLAGLIRQVRSTKAKALFLEKNARSQALQQVSRETGLQIGGTLMADSLSATDGPAPTYEAMIRNNAEIISKALK